ncbi:hypothetical protein [Pedococcus bigeumensis]|uniref:hypothetical protein n=1 Tax=Pedococcus bigeumensis TaxID=433644 RepID=UPI0018839720|nr:hypothetical protein [Pedococcus bigeumensis]
MSHALGRPTLHGRAFLRVTEELGCVQEVLPCLFVVTGAAVGVPGHGGQPLQLVSSTTFTTGVLHLVYAPAPADPASEASDQSEASDPDRCR